MINIKQSKGDMIQTKQAIKDKQLTFKINKEIYKNNLMQETLNIINSIKKNC